ncbi:TSUP family transporter [Modestobacter sp. I12A-02628]|uniref:Probable membrane transporter protein n=1 Tax=Goekera deserti TaxID=2497753 RepID=A0A7K3WBI3_9ACTN|nr:TSUP family transporter [Goekera deserti]MPQ98260.1 TSUP family transporter [Goekera deserti]NDI48086.1 TSUP family transporter [Goekera deserti]NEL53835.1 TSUP family transporter [Goekera deserti]
METVTEQVLVALAVLVGAAAQRVTGLGFALVAAPLLALVAGPVVGVSLSNALAVLLALLVLVRTWRDVWWRRAVLLVACSVVGVLAGSAVTRSAPEGALRIVMGGLVLVAVALVASRRPLPLVSGRGGAVVGGVASGFMNVTAGVGGPALAVHATADRWAPATFVATAQVYFLGVNTASLLTKGLPELPVGQWLTYTAALGVGVALGHLAGRHFPPGALRPAVLALAVAGGVITLLRGIAQALT